MKVEHDFLWCFLGSCGLEVTKKMLSELTVPSHPPTSVEKIKGSDSIKMKLRISIHNIPSLIESDPFIFLFFQRWVGDERVQ